MTTVGRTLGGRYELGELLGTGGMAEVYLARDTRLDRDVAIKLLRNELNSDPSFIARFRREAQSAASLNHHNIVAVYDTGEDEGTPYIVMEYVQGRTLRDVIRGEGPMLPRRALEVTADVCAALSFSHAAGIIHRDIKPANVMLTPSGTVKVMDFGIARALSTSVTMTQTSASTVMGTAQYLSPEQARGEHVDARSDLYSAGCLLYELVAGRSAFVGDSSQSMLYQHVHEQPVPPSHLNRDISPAVDAVVLKAMAKNPGNRYQSAEEMRADLVRASAGRAVQATPLMPEAAATQVLRTVETTQVLRTNPPRPTPARRAGRGAGYLLLLGALIGVFLVAGYVLRNTLTKRTVTPAAAKPVPSVINQPAETAEKILTDAGFVVGRRDLKPDNSGKVAKNRVISQSARAPITLPAGGAVDLVISSGRQQTRVPRLVPLSQADALEELRKVGLVPFREIIVQEDPNAAPNTVLSTDPAAGQVVNVGSAVKIVLSAGELTVPPVVNLPLDQAQTRLEDAGFRVRFAREFSDKPTDIVIKQTPDANIKAPPRSLVTITLSQGASPTPTPEPTTAPPPTTEPASSPPPQTSSAAPPPPSSSAPPAETPPAETPPPPTPTTAPPPTSEPAPAPSDPATPPSDPGATAPAP